LHVAPHRQAADVVGVVEVIFNVEFVKVERDDEGREGRGEEGRADEC